MNNNSKNHSLLELDQKIKNLLFYKRNIHKNSTCSKILELMYPDIKINNRTTSILFRR